MVDNIMSPMDFHQMPTKNVNGTILESGGSNSVTDSGFSSAALSIIDDEPNLHPNMMSYDWEGGYAPTMTAQLLPPSQQPSQPQSTPEPEPMSPASCHMMDTSPSHSSEMASKAIPTLIDLLADEDPVVQIKASNMVLQLSQESGSRDTICNSPQMILALLDTLSRTNNIEIIENGVGVLYSLAEYRLGRQTIYKLCGIPELVRMLSFNSESVVHLSITALHTMLLYQDGAREAVRAAQGLPIMISLLLNPNEQFLSIVIDCIRLLAFGDSETKLVIHGLGGTSELVRILKTCSYVNLLWVVCSTLKVLSACPLNKRTIVENGALQALAMHLKTDIDSHVSNCLFTVRNLSDAAINQEGLEPLLANVMDILRFTLSDSPSTKHEATITCVSGILSNLTCHNQTNKQIVRQLGGVEVLIQTIVEHRSNDDITEPAVCALRHLTCRYPEAELAAHAIRTCQGMVPIINLLNSRSWALKKAAVGLIRNLALCEANIVPLREHYAIQKLTDVLAEVNITARSNDISGVVAPMGVPLIVDPKIEAIIEEATAALTIMSKDPLNKEMIRDALSINAPSNDLAYNRFAF